MARSKAQSALHRVGREGRTAEGGQEIRVWEILMVRMLNRCSHEKQQADTPYPVSFQQDCMAHFCVLSLADRMADSQVENFTEVQTLQRAVVWESCVACAKSSHH